MEIGRRGNKSFVDVCLEDDTRRTERVWSFRSESSPDKYLSKVWHGRHHHGTGYGSELGSTCWGLKCGGCAYEVGAEKGGSGKRQTTVLE